MDMTFGCEYGFLPAGAKAVQEKLDRILNSGYLRASCEYRHTSRTFLVSCLPAHGDGVRRIFEELLEEMVRKEIGVDLYHGDDGEISSKLICRVRYDKDNFELPRDFVDKKQEWPSPISDFKFKSIWEYPKKNNIQSRLIPKHRQNALKALIGVELFEDLDNLCIYVGANSEDNLTIGLQKLDMLQKQVDSFKHGDSHVFFAEHEDKFQVSVRLVSSVKKRLECTTLLDPLHNNGTTEESYQALKEACTIRCAIFDHSHNAFFHKRGQKLFALMKQEAKGNDFQPWKNYVYKTRSISSATRPSSVTKQRDDLSPLIDFEDEDVLSFARQWNNRFPLVGSKGDDRIPGLTLCEKYRNVLDWLSTDLPADVAAIYRQMIHNVCHGDQPAVKLGQVNHGAPESGKQNSMLSGISSEPDFESVRPLNDQRRNLTMNSPGQDFDFFSPLTGKEIASLGRISLEHKAKNRHSATCESVMDFQVSDQKPLRFERSKIEAGSGNPKEKLNVSEAPEALAMLIDLTGDDDPVARTNVLLQRNVEKRFQQAAGSPTGVISSQNKPKPEAQPAQKPATHEEPKHATRQNSTSKTEGMPIRATAKTAFNKPSGVGPATATTETTEYFDKGIVAGMKPIIANMQWWQGEVALEAQLGRIIIQGLAPQLIDPPEKSSPVEEVSHLLQKYSGSVQFTKLVSTLPADAQFILEMKDDADNQIWGPAVQKSVTYQYDCSFPGSEMFSIEIDAESFETSVKSLPSKLGCIFVHGTLRNLDYRIIAQGTRNLDEEHGRLAKAIADTTRVEIKQNRIVLWFKLSKDLDVVVDAVRVYRRSQHLGFHKKSILSITEVHDLDVDLAKSSEWTYRAHSPDSIIQPLWYEMSISSVAVAEILRENSSLELGKEAAWAGRNLICKEVIRSDLCLPANLLVKRLDGLGFYNKNPNNPGEMLGESEAAPFQDGSIPKLPVLPVIIANNIALNVEQVDCVGNPLYCVLVEERGHSMPSECRFSDPGDWPLTNQHSYLSL